MDAEAFLRMVSDPNKTRSELLTIRVNTLAKSRDDLTRAVEEQLDRRFPTWRNPRPSTAAKRRSVALPVDLLPSDSDPKAVVKARPARSDVVAVIPPIALSDESYVKQVLLLFDRIAIDLATTGVSSLLPDLRSAQDLVRRLAANGLVTTVGALLSEQTGHLVSPVSVDGLDLLGDMLGRGFGEKLARSGALASFATIGIRKSAAQLRKERGLDAVIVAPSESLAEIAPPLESDKEVQRDLVFRVTLAEFPVPAETTEWSSILEFKSADHTRRHLSLLRQWINKTATRQSRPAEIRDEIQELQFQYRESLRIHRIKANSGALELFVTVAAEVAEGLVKFKFGEAAKAVFAMKREYVKLIEAEAVAPGREVAYIMHANERFGAPSR